MAVSDFALFDNCAFENDTACFGNLVDLYFSVFLAGPFSFDVS